MYQETLQCSLDVGPDIVDVTKGLATAVGRAGIETGSVHTMVAGSTGSMTTIEYEPAPWHSEPGSRLL